MNSNNQASILQLISSTSFLGAERVLCELSSHLDPACFICTVGLIGTEDHVVDVFRHAFVDGDVSVVHFPCSGKFSWKTVTAIADFVKEQQIDIIHSHGYKSDFYAFIARFFKRSVRIVATNHNWITNSHAEKIYRHIDLHLLKRFCNVIAVSESLALEMVEENICPERIRLIMNGISVTEPPTGPESSKFRIKHGISNSCYVVGCVASLIPVKAHSDLLMAFSRLVNSKHDSLLILVGDGPERGHLEKQAANLGIKDKVFFLGYRQDARELITAFDVFALVSHSEGLPMAMLEAMAASKAVIVSAVGAIPTVITPKENGLLITPGDIEGIATALIQYSNQKEYRHKLGQNARNTVASQYSVERMTLDYERVYKEALAGCP